MLRLSAVRVILGALLVMGGIVTAALPASAGTSCSGTAPLVCVIPNTGVAKHSFVKVVVLTTTPGTAIQITECNPALSTADQAACNTTRVGKSGGIFTATTNAKGKAVFYTYPVLISAKTALGDGFCLTGGGATGTCWIQAQTTGATPTPIAQASFVTA